MAKPGAWQDEPWEGDVVAKVGAKIFVFFGSGESSSSDLTCTGRSHGLKGPCSLTGSE
jgi:hypothetical protein